MKKTVALGEFVGTLAQRGLRMGWLLAASLLLAGLWTGTAGAQPYAYIPNFNLGTLSVIDTTTNTVVATVPVISAPMGTAVNPTGTRVYVSGGGDMPVSHDVSVIDTATNTVVATIPVGGHPYGVAVTPASTFAYVANSNSNSVSVIDTATNTVVATVPVEGFSLGVAVHPAGTRVYVTVSPLDVIAVIDTATNTVVATVPMGNYPSLLAVHPAGTFVYVTHLDDNFVSVIDTATNTVVATVPVGDYPLGPAVHPAGTRVYVPNYNSDTVSVIDTSSNMVVATVTLPAGSGPAAFGNFIGPAPTSITLACVQSVNSSGENTPTAGTNPESGQNPDGFFKVTASDHGTSPSSIRIMLGSFTLTNGETIKLTQVPGESGVRLVNTAGPAEIRHFEVGPGDAVIIATNGSGGTATATCLLPPPPQ